MKVPFLDLKSAYLELQDEINVSISRILSGGVYVLGDEVESFESEWSCYVDAEFCASLGCGLDALILALKALDIGLGDEVLVPSHTFIATWLAVSEVGAMPIPVEPNFETYNLDPSQLASKITSKTKAVIVTHLYGQPADLSAIKEVAEANHLFIIEDAAQAHGARYHQKRIGSYGDIVCWSFYPAKNLGAFGDGGAITTNCERIWNQVKLLRNYGSASKYEHIIRGLNSRLDPIQAAVLRIKLRYLDQWNSRRVQIAQMYSDGLKQCDLVLPCVLANVEPVWHLYVVQISNRQAVQSRLSALGIQTLIHYPVPPADQPAYARVHSGRRFSASDQLRNLSHTLLSLPIGPHLTTAQVDYVIASLKNITVTH